MKFFTSTTFKFFIASSIALGVFFLPINISKEKSVGVISYIHIQQAYALEPFWTTLISGSTFGLLQLTPTDSIANSTEQCQSGAVGCYLLGALIKFLAYIFLLLRSLAGTILGVSAAVLDYSLKATIGFDYSQIGGVSEVWTIIRDIFNVAFVFILLWAGIAKIIGKEKVDAKEVIIGVVIAGLLINFSMFFTRVLIDASNIVSTALYNQVVSINPQAKSSLSSGITQGLGIATITAGDNIFTTDLSTGNKNITSTKNKDTLSISAIIAKFILQTIIYLIAAFAFFSVCILLIGRIVTLTLLLALSPLGFLNKSIGTLLAKMNVDKASNWWWEELLAQMFVTPIFLLLMIITLMVAKQFQAESAQLIGSDPTAKIAISVLLQFGIIIFLILKTVEITKKASGSVGQAINNFGSKAVGFGLGVATGGAAFAARSVIGRTAAKIANRDDLKGAAAKGGLGGFAARMTLKASNATSKASFDARNTASGKFLAKKTGIDTNANIPGFAKAKTGGFAKAQETYAGKKVENAKLMGRENLTKEDATKEYLNLEENKHILNPEEAVRENDDIKTDLRSGMAEDRVKLDKLKAIAVDEKTTKKEKYDAEGEAKAVQEKIKKDTEELAKREARNNEQIMEERKKAFIEKEGGTDAILKKRKTAYQEKYATSTENSWFARARGHNKVAADKIRKDVVGGKSANQKLKEIAEQYKKEEDAKENKVKEVIVEGQEKIAKNPTPTMKNVPPPDDKGGKGSVTVGKN